MAYRVMPHIATMAYRLMEMMFFLPCAPSQLAKLKMFLQVTSIRCVAGVEVTAVMCVPNLLAKAVLVLAVAADECLAGAEVTTPVCVSSVLAKVVMLLGV